MQSARHAAAALVALAAFGMSASQAFAQQVEVRENLAYKSGNGLTDYERERCLLDLYLPAGGGRHPVIVWFHGGGITAGDKAEATQVSIARTLAEHGIAVASVGYRLSPQATFPAYIDDAAASIDWVIDHADEFNIDADAVFVSGHSAGAYLTSMVGIDPQYLARYGHSTADLAGLIPVSGQMVTHFTVRNEQGLPSEHPIIDAAAPIYYVGTEIPPVLAIAGSEDMPGRPEENRYFIAMLNTAEHPDATYLEVEGRTHGSIVTKIPEAGDPVAAAMIGFVERLSGS